MTEARETQVLVIGGSLIGLTSSLLLSSLGVHHEVQATGIGDLWTRQNRWIHSLTGPQIAEVPTESFQMAPVDYSPSMPVMGAQDLIEETLWKAAREQPTADVRFHTIAEDLEQDADGCSANLRDRDTIRSSKSAPSTSSSDPTASSLPTPPPTIRVDRPRYSIAICPSSTGVRSRPLAPCSPKLASTLSLLLPTTLRPHHLL